MVTVNFFATPKTIFRCLYVLELICRSKSSWSRTLNDCIEFCLREGPGQDGGEKQGTIAGSSINHSSLAH